MELTEKVLAFQLGHWTWTDLWKGILMDANQFFAMNGVSDEIAIQVISKLGPRLPAMVSSFSYVGKSFEAFFHTALRFQLKSAYLEQKRERERIALLPHFVWSDTDYPEELAFESPEHEYGIVWQSPSQEEVSRQKKRVSKLKPDQRRELILAMKNCANLPDSACATMAKAYGLDYIWLLNCRDELRESALKRTELYREIQLRERRLIFSIHLDRATDTSCESRLKKLAALQKRLGELHPFPRHGDIAEKLGLPKGSIDSSLYYLRNQLARKQEDGIAKKTGGVHYGHHETRTGKQQRSQDS